MKWVQEKEKREKASLERHSRLSVLFKEDRLSFERERKKMIDEVIDSVKDEELKQQLTDLQKDWDRKMKGAGSQHNRFVLAQTFFWSQFHESWQPAIKQFKSFLDRKF